MTAPTKPTPLGDLMAESQGSVDPAAFDTEVFDLFSIPAYDRQAPDVLTGAEIGSAKKVVQPGDLLLSRIVPHIRRAWVVPESNGRRQIASGEWIVFRSPRIIPSYLRHLLMSDVFHPQFMNTVAGVGGSLLRARPAFVAQIEIPLPYPDDPARSLAEQKRIADILDKADAIRRKRQEAVSRINDIPTALFLELFGDPRTNERSWPTEQLKNLVEESRPITYGILKPGPNVSGGVPMLRIQDIRGDQMDITDLHYVSRDLSEQYKRTILDGTEIVISLVGTVGLVAMVPQSYAGGNVHRNLGVIVPNARVRRPYLFHLLASPLFPAMLNSVVKGGNQALLNLGDLGRVSVPLPPADLQDEFVRLVGHQQSLYNSSAAGVREAENLFETLGQRAFRGEM